MDALLDMLSRTEFARYVRCLIIKGGLHLDIESGKATISALDYKFRELSRLRKEASHEVFGHQEDPVFGTDSRHIVTGPVIQASSGDNIAWAPVASLIKRLPGLRVLEYRCLEQFPPILLDSIQEYKCNLHYMSFRLYSLLLDEPDPYEIALAMSPCLTKAQIRCNWRDSNGDDDFNQEAIMELVAGLAPNLKDIVIIGLNPPIPLLKRCRPRGVWRGLPGFVINQSIGLLSSLKILGSVNPNLETIQGWANYTDFGYLHYLCLGGGYDSYNMSNAGIGE